MASHFDYIKVGAVQAVRNLSYDEGKCTWELQG